MEGKTVILSVLIMSLVMAQNPVEAKSCCPTTTARNIYYACRLIKRPRETCAKISGCTPIPDGTSCPPRYAYDILENSGAAFSEYCKLGCTSSVCGALTSLEYSDASEIVTGAIAQCTNACASFCAKGSANAVETA